MIAMIAPARNLRPAVPEGICVTKAPFAAEAAQLAKALCGYSPWQLESLLDVPPARAFDLYDAYRAFDARAAGTPALPSYYGAAYRNMALGDFTPADYAFAQEHLRILSALYGLLRPLDGVLPHRLGMKKEFCPGGKTLYEFWGDKLYKALYSGGGPVVNLASEEYAKLIQPFVKPGEEMLRCRFLVEKPGGARGTVATIRAARGLMVRYIVKHRIDAPVDLCGFDADGYRFAEMLSGRHEYVFVKWRGFGGV